MKSRIPIEIKKIHMCRVYVCEWMWDVFISVVLHLILASFTSTYQQIDIFPFFLSFFFLRRQAVFFLFLFIFFKAKHYKSFNWWILRAHDDIILNVNKNEFDSLVKLHKCKKWQDEEFRTKNIGFANTTYQ